MSGLPFERLFSVGAFDALRSLRILAQQFPSLEADDLTSVLKETNSEMTGLDFEAAIALSTLVSADAPLEEAHLFYRECISCIVLSHGQSWSRAITRGRTRFLSQVSRDEHLCFRAALLTDVPLTDEIVAWWDAISASVRQVADQARMDRARRAERLTLAREQQRVLQLGIDAEPKWIAIDDNTAGYDVLSFDPGEFGPTNRLIEVKSTIASPLRFILTRNEWETALKFGPAYHFHVWDLAPEAPRLYERTTAQIAAHIPTDQASGKWTTAEIPVGATNSTH